MSEFNARWIMTRDRWLVRVLRWTWVHGDGPGTGRGWSAKFTVAFRPRLFFWRRVRKPEEWLLVVLGIRLHYLRAYGGRIAP